MKYKTFLWILILLIIPTAYASWLDTPPPLLSITGSTLESNTTYIFTLSNNSQIGLLSCPNNYILRYNITYGGFQCQELGLTGTGTVTNVATDDKYILGGPITTTGTISLDESVLNATIDARSSSITGTDVVGWVGNWSADKEVINASIVANTADIETNAVNIADNTAQILVHNDSIIDNKNNILTRAFPGDCPNGYVVQNTTTSGVECVLDSDTIYTAGNGLQLILNEFSINAVTANVNEYSYWSGSSWLTRLDQDTTYTEDSKYLTLAGTVFGFDEVELNSTIDSRTTATTYIPTQLYVEEGIINSGNLTSIQYFYDDDVLDIQEEGGTSSILIYINFTNVEKFNSILLRQYYIGGSGHIIELQLYNFVDDVWVPYYDISDESDYINEVISIFNSDDYIDGSGTVMLRFYHVDNGNSGHQFFIDGINLIDGVTTVTNTEHDGLAGRNNFLSNHPLYAHFILGLNASNATTNIRIDNVLTDITNLQNSLINTNDTVNQNVLDIATNSAQLLIHNQSIMDNYGWLTSLSSSLANTNSTVNSNTASIADNSQQLVIHNSSIIDNKNNIATNTGDITTNSNSITSLEGSLSNTNDTVNTINSNYWNTGNDIDTVLSDDELSENKIEFTTTCSSGNHLYISGNDLACEADSDTTYSAGNGISLSGTTFSVAGNTALTQDSDGLSVTNDAIGDTQLTYNTGQHLTTTSNVKHNNFNVTGYTTYEETDGNIEEYSNSCNMKVNSTGIYFIC